MPHVAPDDLKKGPFCGPSCYPAIIRRLDNGRLDAGGWAIEHDAATHEEAGREAEIRSAMRVYADDPLVQASAEGRGHLGWPLSLQQARLLSALCARLGSVVLYDDLIATVFSPRAPARRSVELHRLRVLKARLIIRLGDMGKRIRTVPGVGMLATRSTHARLDTRTRANRRQA